ncbi:gluconeogenesis factor YvcK family protein [Evansella cellulosilytica]|uniref:Gluconeogenesis factor n=1 Tax=Evansella cellulosilytica (strain ATCC 21833 / DSM 2522 / FERM P-1141 / JCM 9156 / N-4) TaxID=649639 RepID=E6TRD9_EVAC2|nr:YvcK family protein [Evansella cellulosilytica]ADU31769.1 protein of unknown function UPF0052 and CofD [Evansella cellulosilytica DSM 2522]
MKKANIVVIGGGTGLSVLLRGLKTFPVDITAIVTVADDGGSSGRLRRELKIPPPGDVRNVLVALSEVEPLVEELFQHRFEPGNSLSGHSLGNLLLAGMTSITGDFSRGVQELSRVLNVKGKVLPATNQEVVLHAELEDGSLVEGESQIPLSGKKIKKVFIEPEKPAPLDETLLAIEKADLIVLGPGSLFTSVLPNLLVPEISRKVKESKAWKVYICNVMTQPGETDNFTAADHIKAIYDHIDMPFLHAILVNNQKIPFSYSQRYLEEGAKEVIVDEHRLKEMGLEVVADNLLYFDNEYLRHDALKLSQRLISML